MCRKKSRDSADAMRKDPCSSADAMRKDPCSSTDNYEDTTTDTPSTFPCVAYSTHAQSQNDGIYEPIQ